MNNIEISQFRSWLESLPEDTAFDFGNTVGCVAARFLASVSDTKNGVSVYVPPIGKGLVHSGTLDCSFPDDHWFARLARHSYSNRVRTVAQVKTFLETL